MFQAAYQGHNSTRPARKRVLSPGQCSSQLASGRSVPHVPEEFESCRWPDLGGAQGHEVQNPCLGPQGHCRLFRHTRNPHVHTLPF